MRCTDAWVWICVLCVVVCYVLQLWRAWGFGSYITEVKDVLQECKSVALKRRKAQLPAGEPRHPGGGAAQAATGAVRQGETTAAAAPLVVLELVGREMKPVQKSLVIYHFLSWFVNIFD